MIQRIQSIFLLIVVFLSGMLFLLDFSYFQKGIEVLNFNICGIEETVTTWPLAILNFLVLIIALVAIFMYKNRILQIRLIVFNIVLMLGIYALMSFYIYKLSGTMDIHYNTAIVFPFINIVLSYLAIRSIGKDEALVRSLDRLR